MNKDFKSGFVAIIGRPNVGKSTLLNQFLKHKVVIVSPKAQTTRNKIQGIYTDSEAQIIFIDTPGVHKAKTELGKVMNEFAATALGGVDVVLLMVDATEKMGSGEKFIIDELLKAKIPTILVANKVDLVKSQDELVENMDSYKEAFPFKGGIAISATSNFKVDDLMTMIKDLLDKGPMYYPEDQLLDQPERFVVAEIIREKVLLKTEDEVPHSVAVEIESFKESTKTKGLVEIHATIVVERQSQKKIIIGAKGAKIKEIGTLARKDISNLLGNKVYLELFVKVEEDWRNRKKHLKSFGYNVEL